ncbi:hypothetical protein H6P87_00013 [Rickettsia tillamookensis]|uniref:Ankyrin repeat protein n=1 Tax=Rickettsia tillamookensis TaxID=2761623 RepID=A0A9E6MGE0_9RICK|nr:ankyrin repeat domain-containing protein [Rickettsia tillamookensis]QQV74481.1 hypothetical protein H6P87_00013 [Rickettsia tillamookensis]
MLTAIFGESDEVLYGKLIKAIKDENTLEAERLIDKIKNTDLFNQSDKNDNTALILAADTKLPIVCKKLISKMSNEAINIIENKHKDSALRKAIRNDLDDVAQELIPRTFKDNINVIDRYPGNTLLILAAKKGMNKVCIMLISRMSDDLELINHINKEGDTAVSVAAASVASRDTNFKEAFKLLQQKQEEFLKTITITKQNVENSLKATSFNLESAFNANKKTLNDLLEKKEKLGDDKATLLRINVKIENILNNNTINKKLTDLDNYINYLVDSQKPQEVDTSEILGGVKGLHLE